MTVIYVALNVLGDAGANAAEIFPRLAAGSAGAGRVIVADAPRNREYIVGVQGAEFLALRPMRRWPLITQIRNGLRLARKARAAGADVVHVFYRLANVPLIVALRLGLIAGRARTRILLDHRSVNLARGPRRLIKLSANLLAQAAAHGLAGNPLAVATNHARVFRPSSVIDLGYDIGAGLPKARHAHGETAEFWYVGSLKPRNRRTGFLIDIWDGLADPGPGGPPVRINVAGPATDDQIARLTASPAVAYHGTLPRPALYDLMARRPGIGIAFMNARHHGDAPSLKFSEYAMLGFPVLASDTRGLRLQAARMEIPGVRFVAETAADWESEMRWAARHWHRTRTDWRAAPLWSYDSIFARQVLPLYRRMAGHG